MIFMATSRRLRNGVFGDEEESRRRFRYQINYDGRPRGQDGFETVSLAAFKRAVLAELNRLKNEEGVSTPKVGIYLHGYNNDYHDSIDEIVDLEKTMEEELGYAPVIIGFSWPSSGQTAYYLSDREEVRDSVPAFTRFLRDMNQFMTENETDCFSTTYCVVHSMGNYMLRKGLEYLSDNLGTPVGRLLFAETIMIGADLASADVQRGGKGSVIGQFSRRVHIYYSRHDRALKASSAKRFGGDRLGRHGPTSFEDLMDNAVAVDCKEFANSESMKGLLDRAEQQVLVHSSYRYHPRILKDIVSVLSSTDRTLIVGREPIPDAGVDRGNHYRLVDL